MRTSIPVHTTDVLVVGAGPVGLALAIVLARAGVECRIIEREPEFRDRGERAKGINARSLEVFEDLGVVERMLALGRTDLRVRTYRGARVIGEATRPDATRPTPDRPYTDALMLAQHHTEAVLRERLAEFGVKVELDCELVEFSQEEEAAEEEAVKATVRQGGESRTLRARYLVGCDGGRSTVRRQAGFTFLGESWDEERFLLASLRVEGLDPDFLHVWTDEKLGAGAFILVPMRADGLWAAHAWVDPDEQGRTPAPDLATFERLFAERAGLPGVRLHEPSWSSVWRPTVRMVDRYRAGRVFVAGDAAHCHSAAGGQGLNTGVQDAANLGWKLAAVLRGAPDALLDSYQAERLPVAAGVLAATSAQHRALFSEGGGQALARQFGNRTASGADFTGLSIGYRGGPIGLDLDDSTGIRAGDRAPDAPVTTASGTPTRLFDLLRGPHATLLAFDADLRLPERPGLRQAGLRDPSGHAGRAYGLGGPAVVLVRPDGYVALTGSAASVAAQPEALAGVMAGIGL
ncbi:FAD-dependent monooxygenase [Kitasatospora sp. NPDC051170]|uniref:FAD-dependent monooxygenase n=1 Tax=Kitasatospora sp. NPDC051170 TaxID=3364056 RepID=UPI0037B57551